MIEWTIEGKTRINFSDFDSYKCKITMAVNEIVADLAKRSVRNWIPRVIDEINTILIHELVHACFKGGFPECPLGPTSRDWWRFHRRWTPFIRKAIKNGK